ncbi:MAG: molecular chaperone TorD family protein [Betaproteobacteria bacterium]|jgi:TorA maturation chaperone TorD|nr:molecular chaperone TorD family protein [Betaproteobacteria bacterium]
MAETPLDSAPPVAPEDLARADLYGVLARLYYAAPDAQLLAALANAPDPPASDNSPLAEAWQALRAACRSAFPVMLENEHTRLFVGTGKAEVTPYLSKYVLRHQADTPLADVREALRQLGIARREGVGEYEDHVAGMLETMRFLIAVQRRSLEEQRDFFERYVHDASVAFCSALSDSEHAFFYKVVARLTRIFMDVEKNAFSML